MTLTGFMVNDVEDFHRQFRIPHADKPTPLLQVMPPQLGAQRLKHLREELQEYERAVSDNDVAGQADALVDLVYVAIGNALVQGIPWFRIWHAVHAANMRKVFDPRNPKGVTKPPNWQAPNIAAELKP